VSEKSRLAEKRVVIMRFCSIFVVLMQKTLASAAALGEYINRRIFKQWMYVVVARPYRSAFP
jgi:hypothetical protein